MAHRVPITVRVDHFEGPLDLLLYLIQSHELDVSKVSISKITDQYLAYVRLMQELNFDIASDFLLMAATLIQWKSKSLLPVETDPNALLSLGDDDLLSPEDLLRQLREHQRFLEAGRELGLQPLLGDDVYTRPNSRKPTEKVWKQMDVTGLALTFQDLLVKERKRTTILKKETVSLAEKILDFGERMEVGSLMGLRALLRDPNSRPETVVSFLATLELGRLKKMRLHQEKAYEEIYVELLESIKGFDTNLARGFDSIEEAVDQGIAERAARGEGHAAETLAAVTAAATSEATERGIETSDAGVDRAALFVADDSRAENAAGHGDHSSSGLAREHSGDESSTPGNDFDLAGFGETREPDLRDILAGTHHAAHNAGAEVGLETNGNRIPADGRGDGDRDGTRSSDRSNDES